MTHNSMPLDPALLDRFVAIVGAGHALRETADIEPYVTERRGRYPGLSPLVLQPGSVDEVSRIMKLATETGTAIVPQGGNTGLVGAQMPDRSGTQVVLSLSRLNRIREIDTLSNTVTAEAGVILEKLHEAADAAGRLFPLSLGSQARARSVAISLPMRAAPAFCPTATRVNSASASRWCCPPARCSTICAS